MEKNNINQPSQNSQGFLLRGEYRGAGELRVYAATADRPSRSTRSLVFETTNAGAISTVEISCDGEPPSYLEKGKIVEVRVKFAAYKDKVYVKLL